MISLNSLKSELRKRVSKKYGKYLESLGLKVAIKYTLSSHDQVMQILLNEFNIPIEIIIKILSNLSIPYLHKTLGATLDQLLVYVRMNGYDNFQSQLMDIGGFEILDDGSTKLIFEKYVAVV